MSCSNPEEAAAKEVMPKRQVNLDPNCGRCREAASLYLIRNITYCRKCFEHMITMRICKSLHPPMLPDVGGKKTHQQRPHMQSGDVLVALSGGAGSTTLLHQLYLHDYYGKASRNGQWDPRQGQKPTVWKNGWAVHVDFSSVTSTASQMETLRALAEERELRFVDVKAEDVFDPSFRARLAKLGGDDAATTSSAMSVNLGESGLPLYPAPETSSSTATPLQHLETLLASLPPPSRPALLADILNALLTEVALSLPNIQHLLTGETSTREAQRVISGTASGRGWALPLELARQRDLPSSSGEAVVLIKAMKEVSLKEAAFWAHGHRLSTMNERRWDSTVGGSRRDARGKGTIASIEALTEKFIAGLNVSHSSTVTTINKTGDKLRFTGDKSAPLCPVCQMPVDPSASEWKAQASLTALPGRGSQEAQTLPDDPLAPLLCYACLTTFTPLSAAQRDQPRSEAVQLPLWIGDQVQELASKRQPMTQDQMKAEVSAFLLE